MPAQNLGPLPDRDVVALAARVARAAKNPRIRGPPVHFLDDSEFDFSKPEARELYEILVRAYPRSQQADMALAMAGIDRSGINLGQGARFLWKEAVEVAAQAREEVVGGAHESTLNRTPARVPPPTRSRCGGAFRRSPGGRGS